MEQQKKSLKPWIILLVLPIPLLVFTALLQMIVRFLKNGSDGGAVFLVVNIFSLLLGIASVVLLMGIPIWIVFLVLAYEHNSKLEQRHATQPESSDNQ